MNAVRPLFAALALVSLTMGCKITIPKNKPLAQAAPTASAVTSASAPSVSASAPSSAAAIVKEDKLFRVPVGPAYTILPGEGIGPVRFGARLKTVERLMEGECTELTEHQGRQWCRYQPNAVDFGFEDDSLVEIHIHGIEREFVPGKGLGVDNIYGVFRGTFGNKAQLGMYPQFIEQGEPLRVEKVEPGRFSTVEKHHYENMVLEFDKLKNGNVVLGGVVLTKPSKPLKPPSKAKAHKEPRKRKLPIH